MSHTTKSYGKENSWTLGECSSTAVHANSETYEEECCLPPGEYTLECKDTYGDGWNGGYITINGEDYCKTFTSGHSTTREILWGEATEPDGRIFNWLFIIILCRKN